MVGAFPIPKGIMKFPKYYTMHKQNFLYESVLSDKEILYYNLKYIYLISFLKDLNCLFVFLIAKATSGHAFSQLQSG